MRCVRISYYCETLFVIISLKLELCMLFWGFTSKLLTLNLIVFETSKFLNICRKKSELEMIILNLKKSIQTLLMPFMVIVFFFSGNSQLICFHSVYFSIVIVALMLYLWLTSNSNHGQGTKLAIHWQIKWMTSDSIGGLLKVYFTVNSSLQHIRLLQRPCPCTSVNNCITRLWWTLAVHCCSSVSFSRSLSVTIMPM